MFFRAIIIALFLGAAGSIQAKTVTRDGRVFDVLKVRGWVVNVEQTVTEFEWNWHRAQLEPSLEFIESAIPGKLKILKTVPIWVRDEVCGDGICAGEFNWVTTPFFGVSIFLPEVNPPMTFYSYRALVVHEFAHAYQGLALRTRHNDAIERAWKFADISGRYRDVDYYYGGTDPVAYALTNDQEYFAELTLSYFNIADVEPFTRSHLENYDPLGLQAVRAAWTAPLSGQFRPDLLYFDSRRRLKGDNKIERKPRSQTLEVSSRLRKVDVYLRLQNDGAYDNIRVTGSGIRKMRGFKIGSTTGRGYKNVTSLFRRGNYTEELGEGGYWGYRISFRQTPGASRKRTAIIRARSSLFSNSADSVAVKWRD